MRSNGGSNNGSNFVSFAERLKSFSKKSPKWPHPNSFVANPSSLATAGFYFSPSNDNKDAVSCFICQKGLADWDPADDPAIIHFDKCSTCPWAILKCTSDIPDSEGRYNFPPSRIPSSKEMEKARLETFAPGGKSWWPQDGRNKGPSSKLMAKAGFIFTPSSSSKKDDTCSCIYCGIELSGWQIDDDPMEEHRRREEKNGPCPFFTVQEAPVKQNIKKTKAPTSKAKAKSKVKPKSRANREQEQERGSGPEPRLSAELAPELPPQPQPELQSQPQPELRPEPQAELQPEQEHEYERKQQQQYKPHLDLEQRATKPEQKLVTESEQRLATEPEQGLGIAPDLELISEERNQTPISGSTTRLSISIPPAQSFTEAERLMTIEQWIRAEMERQYELFKAHGRSRIEAFKLQASEVAKRIEQL